MFIKNEACSITNCEPGVTRKVMGYNDDVMMCEITFEEGAKAMSMPIPIPRSRTLRKGNLSLPSVGKAGLSQRGTVF